MKKLYLILNSLLILIFLIKFVLASEEKTITGKAYVVDGDTIIIGEEKIRLYGIDAPEMKQVCYSKLNEPYFCGLKSKNFLEKLNKDKKLICYYSQRDRYKRIIGDCYNKNKNNINALMVLFGHAVAYERYSKKYILQEEKAKLNEKGIWQGNFDRPEEWRKKNK